MNASASTYPAAASSCKPNAIIVGDARRHRSSRPLGDRPGAPGGAVPPDRRDARRRARATVNRCRVALVIGGVLARARRRCCCSSGCSAAQRHLVRRCRRAARCSSASSCSARCSRATSRACIGAPLAKLRASPGTSRARTRRATRSARRRPRAALMIGVALVGFITIFAASAKRRSAARSTQIKSDYVINSGGGSAAPGSARARRRASRRCRRSQPSTPMRLGPVEVNGSRPRSCAADPGRAAAVRLRSRSRGRSPSSRPTASRSRRNADDAPLEDRRQIPVKFVEDRQVVPLPVECIYKRTDACRRLPHLARRLRAELHRTSSTS